MPFDPPTLTEIRTVAKKATEILRRNGLHCCLFGSAACMLYGNSRTPNDVDIVVMTTTRTTEELKALLARTGGFYLRPSQRPGETYKILYYRLKKSAVAPHRSCKVDILVPGIMNIPLIPTNKIFFKDGLPVLPILPLLLLKLQGWEDHRTSPRSDVPQKQLADVRDIAQLVATAARRAADIHKETYLPDEFIRQGQERLDRFMVIVRPAEPLLWGRIGFLVNGMEVVQTGYLVVSST